MVKDVTSFTNAIWEVGVCLNVCVQGFMQDLSFGRGELQSSVLMWRGCTAHNN